MYLNSGKKKVYFPQKNSIRGLCVYFRMQFDFVAARMEKTRVGVLFLCCFSILFVRK